jgi:DNA-binding transcriptional ArsR family regulator
MRELMHITDRAAAAAFASPRRRGIVQTLMAGEMAMGELASATQLPLSLLHYHVTQCMRLGLIEITREQPRSGRAVKFYRAVAKSFFVAAELVDEMPGTGFTRKLRDRLDQNLNRSLQGICFGHDGVRPRADLVTDPDQQNEAVELWLDVGLTGADAARLRQELQVLMDRFRACDNAASPRYLLHMAAVKL